MPSGVYRSLAALREAIHASPSALPTALADIYTGVLEEIEHLERNIRAVETALRTLTRRDPIVRGLRQICGVGPLIATALRGAVGEIERFPTGRHFASWLGLTAADIRPAAANAWAGTAAAAIVICGRSWSTALVPH